jgi:predicted transcriptional regulator
MVSNSQRLSRTFNMSISKHRSEPILILSILPIHAEKIFNGTKLFELRKILPKAPFSRVYLYETGGKGITGCFNAATPHKAEIDQLWSIVGERATTRDRFFSYFAKSKFGYAIPIKSPVAFGKPITPSSIKRQINKKFSAPMSFLLAFPNQRIFKVLEEYRKDECLRQSVQLRPISESEKTLFVQLVTEEISPRYDDITEKFARAILKTNGLPLDPNGIFTRKKRVLTIRDSKGRMVGFTTLTYKIGGCVKTGPTILLQKWRRKGFGTATRKAILEMSRRDAIRKLYCTCPDNDQAVISYLIKAGFHIEAHLTKHYSTTHGELVLGQVLEHATKTSPTCVHRKDSKAKLLKPEVVPVEKLAKAFRKSFSETWIPINYSLARFIVANANRPKSTYEEKPTTLISFGKGQKSKAHILLVPKRGGAVKAVWLSTTCHKQSLHEMVKCAEDFLVYHHKRKIYFVHPADDKDLIEILKERNYEAEGLLREPYRKGQDALVLSKLLRP